MSEGQSRIYPIEILDEFGAALPAERITAAIQWVLSQHAAPAGTGVTLVVAGNEQVRALNAQYRGVDAATDVLSFPAEPLPDDLRQAMTDAGDDGTLYLGDLIIAYPYTVQHARSAGHALDDELVLLAVHGALHLLGFDHDNAAHQAAMWGAQSEALAALGVALRVPQFTFDDEDEGDERR
jgi:probable rRNA maturation factor